MNTRSLQSRNSPLSKTEEDNGRLRKRARFRNAESSEAAGLERRSILRRLSESKNSRLSPLTIQDSEAETSSDEVSFDKHQQEEDHDICTISSMRSSPANDAGTVNSPRDDNRQLDGANKLAGYYDPGSQDFESEVKPEQRTKGSVNDGLDNGEGYLKRSLSKADADLRKNLHRQKKVQKLRKKTDDELKALKSEEIEIRFYLGILEGSCR